VWKIKKIALSVAIGIVPSIVRETSAKRSLYFRFYLPKIVIFEGRIIEKTRFFFFADSSTLPPYM